MGCNSDYMESNQKEKHLRKTAQILCFVYNKLGMKISKALKDAADDYYCRVDFVPELCATMKIPEAEALRFPTKEQFKAMSEADRKLLTEFQAWANDHEAADERRIAAEKAAKKKASAIKKAKSKLSPEERNALGID